MKKRKNMLPAACHKISFLRLKNALLLLILAQLSEAQALPKLYDYWLFQGPVIIIRGGGYD